MERASSQTSLGPGGVAAAAGWKMQSLVQTSALCLHTICPFLASPALIRTLGTLPRAPLGLEASTQPRKSRTLRPPGSDAHSGGLVSQPHARAHSPLRLVLYTETTGFCYRFFTVTVFSYMIKTLRFYYSLWFLVYFNNHLTNFCESPHLPPSFAYI